MDYNLLTERQKFRASLLEWNSYDVQKAWEAYDFIMKYDEVEEKCGCKTDGIYLVLRSGYTLPHIQGVKYSEKEREACIGIGIKMGSRSLTVSLEDACKDALNLSNGLYKKENTLFYRTAEQDAVVDWNGLENTSRIENINGSISLKNNTYIPSIGEMYLIFTNLKNINAAIESVHGQPLNPSWYWTSTEYSASEAWYIDLITGAIITGKKGLSFNYVRLVSNF